MVPGARRVKTGQLLRLYLDDRTDRLLQTVCARLLRQYVLLRKKANQCYDGYSFHVVVDCKGTKRIANRTPYN